MKIRRTALTAALGCMAFWSLSPPAPAQARLHRGFSPPAKQSLSLFAPSSQSTAEFGTIRLGRPTFFSSQSSWIQTSPPRYDLFPAPGVLQCVPFARFMSGIGIRGDAWTWWEKAAGIYARGNRPEPGAVLSFPGIWRMPLGHVAVVTQVMDARKILIDHANWPTASIPHGAISRDILVTDVSPGNDWSEVRVQFGEGGPLGSVYPANGFIYEWNEAGVQIARPRFPMPEVAGVPNDPRWQMFLSVSYVWALAPTDGRRVYASAGMARTGASPNARVRPVLALEPATQRLNMFWRGRVAIR